MTDQLSDDDRPRPLGGPGSTPGSTGSGLTISTAAPNPTVPGGPGTEHLGGSGAGCGAAVDWEEWVWESLLESIGENNVVPIIGRDLLEIAAPDTGRRENLYDYMARRLVAQLPRQMTAFFPEAANNGWTLNDAICLWLRSGRPPAQIRSAVRTILGEIDENFIPEPLLQIAEISDFSLLVTTTFDNLLERAVASAGSGTEARLPTVRAFDPEAHVKGSVEDLPSATSHRPLKPEIYHLMGKLRTANSNVVLTDNDMLEVVMALCSAREAQVPVQLMTALRTNHLLLLGVRFSDWLARFFLRAARQVPLGGVGPAVQRSGLVEYVVDTQVPSDRNLVLYLEQFCTSARVYQGGDVVTFVDRLRERWGRLHPHKISAIRRDDLASSQPATRAASTKPDGSIFISYSRDDERIVERIVSSLGEFPLWFDREKIAAGSTWETDIEQGLKKCRFFMPIISRNTNRRQEGYFWREWNLAAERLRMMSPDSGFLLPVVIDDLGKQQPRVPKSFLDYHMHQLPNGTVDAGFVRRVRELFQTGAGAGADTNE